MSNSNNITIQILTFVFFFNKKYWLKFYFHLLLSKFVYNLHSEWVVFFFCFFRNISYSRSVLSKPVRNIWGFGTWSTAKLSVSRRYYFYVYKSVTRNIFDIHFPYRIVNGEVESSRHKTTLSRRPNPAYKKTNKLPSQERREWNL